MDKRPISYFISWALVLAVFWLLLSGFLKFLLLSFGVASVVLVIYLLRRMDKADGQPDKIALSFSLFGYIAWLLKEITTSSLAVTKLVWGNSKNLSPAIAKLPVSDMPDDTHVLYANSITLTPGTLSVDIDDEFVTVHALEAESLEELKQGEMAGKAANVTGAKK